MEKSRWDVEPFSSFGKPLSKGERNRHLECVHDSEIERERILSEQRDIHDILGRELIMLFKETAQLRQYCLMRSLNWTEETGECKNAEIALFETSMQLQSQRMELYQANQLTDQTRREKELAMQRIRNEKQSFSGRSCKKLPTNSRITENLLHRG